MRHGPTRLLRPAPRSRSSWRSRGRGRRARQPAAPAFSARLLDEGRTLDSRALIGKKVVVLRFQGSWCKVCTAQAGAIQRLTEKYRPA